jgi:pyroglutamyl-peptidase
VDRVLVTGFEPYGTTPVNPAQLVAEALHGDEVGGSPVEGVTVPNTWFESIEVVSARIDEHRPTIVVMLGGYPGRTMVTVERLAQNLNDSARYRVADNAGVVLEDEVTVPGGPVGYYATLPIRSMVLAMRAAGIPADISDTAGTLVCNQLMYGVLHHIAETGLDVRAGWVHLPHLPEVAALDRNLGHPSMALETMTAAVRTGIAAALAHPADVEDPVHSRLQI